GRVSRSDAPVMITGDHALTAKAIARQLGILEADGRFRLVGKGQVDFAAAIADLIAPSSPTSRHRASGF
ncbi:MAG: hypothetical protein EBX57_12750, partial [Betaproteobacteria bacterium]|nr:hypothetical protein [Betaproteobacteria bacterium]